MWWCMMKLFFLQPPPPPPLLLSFQLNPMQPMSLTQWPSLLSLPLIMWLMQSTPLPHDTWTEQAVANSYINMLCLAYKHVCLCREHVWSVCVCFFRYEREVQSSIPMSETFKLIGVEDLNSSFMPKNAHTCSHTNTQVYMHGHTHKHTITHTHTHTHTHTSLEI